MRRGRLQRERRAGFRAAGAALPAIPGAGFRRPPATQGTKDGSLDAQKLHASQTQRGAAIPGGGVRLGHAQRVYAPGLAPSEAPKVTVLVPQNGEKKGEIGQSLGWGGEPRVQRW